MEAGLAVSDYKVLRAGQVEQCHGVMYWILVNFYDYPFVYVSVLGRQSLPPPPL
jgi:hypothetical protein